MVQDSPIIVTMKHKQEVIGRRSRSLQWVDSGMEDPQKDPQCLKWSKTEAGSLPQTEVEFPYAEFLLSENGEFCCILSGILCDLELQESKQETRYRPGKSKGAGSPTMTTRPHFKP